MGINAQALSSHFGGYEEVPRAQNGHGGCNGQSLEVVHADSSDGVSVLFQSNTVADRRVKQWRWGGQRYDGILHVANIAL
jgi:hypothetical protein